MSVGWVFVRYLQGARLTTLGLAVVTANFAVLYVWTVALLGEVVLIPLTAMTFVAVLSLVLHLSSRSLHTIGVLKAMGAGPAAITAAQFSGLMVVGLAGAAAGLSAGLAVSTFIFGSGQFEVGILLRSWMGLLSGGLLVVVASVGLAVYSAWKRASTSVAEMLKNG